MQEVSQTGEDSIFACRRAVEHRSATSRPARELKKTLVLAQHLEMSLCVIYTRYITVMREFCGDGYFLEF